MRFLAGRSVCVLLLLLLASGCFQMPESKMEEQKDPHFLAGRERVVRRDYPGAIESFEKVLDANPRSSAAHFELGTLYEERSTNYARAIYHYERHLELNPGSNMAEVVKSHIATCKLELAKGSSFSVVSQEMQKETDRLQAELGRLRQTNEVLKAQLAQMSQRPPSVTLQPTPTPLVTNRAPSPAPAPAVLAARVEPKPADPVSPRSSSVRPPATPSPSAAKTHSVARGETPAVIARRYNITVNALMAANPGLDARRMKVGQVLRLPATKP